MTKPRIYGDWAGNPKGTPEDPARCIKAVWPNDRHAVPYQCRRKRGYGEGGLYCKQHANDEKRAAERTAKYEQRERENEAIQEEAKKLSKRLGVKVVAHYDRDSMRFLRRGLVSFEDLEKLEGPK